MRPTITMLLVSLCLSLYGQDQSSTSKSESNTFVAYITSSSSQQDLKDMEDQIQKDGFELNLSDAIFSQEGGLQSVKVSLISQCLGQPFYHDQTVDIGSKSNFRLGVIFIGERCETGSFKSAFGNLQSITDYLFKNKAPDFTYHAWSSAINQHKGLASVK